MGAGNSSVYACSITAPTGATITLTNTRTAGQTYSYTQSLTQDCQTHTNVNFP
jgi:hypothetical protein